LDQPHRNVNTLFAHRPEPERQAPPPSGTRSLFQTSRNHLGYAVDGSQNETKSRGYLFGKMATWTVFVQVPMADWREMICELRSRQEKAKKPTGIPAVISRAKTPAN